MKAKIRPKKSPSLAALKKRCDRAFSSYIRTRDIDRHGNTSCVTCGTTAHWKQLQCGHFISRNYLATRFDEKNAFPQCVGCNIFKKGAYPEFAVFLTQEFGHGILQQLLNTKHQPVKFSKADYLEMIEKFSVDAPTVKAEKPRTYKTSELDD